MNLTLFFRLILMSIFQKRVTQMMKTFRGDDKYKEIYFFCPRVYAMDGFSVSLQIHSGNYCSSENGYRQFGHTMQEVEFGFPSEDEPMLREYAEDPDNITGTVGRIPVNVLEEMFAKHGGIDWQKTISVKEFESIT
jgi:hypothetical protein